MVCGPLLPRSLINKKSCVDRCASAPGPAWLRSADDGGGGGEGKCRFLKACSWARLNSISLPPPAWRMADNLRTKSPTPATQCFPRRESIMQIFPRREAKSCGLVCASERCCCHMSCNFTARLWAGTIINRDYNHLHWSPFTVILKWVLYSSVFVFS